MIVHTRHADINLNEYDGLMLDNSSTGSEICLWGTSKKGTGIDRVMNFDFRGEATRFLCNMIDAMIEGQEEFDATGYDIVFGWYDLKELRETRCPRKEVVE